MHDERKCVGVGRSNRLSCCNPSICERNLLPVGL